MSASIKLAIVAAMEREVRPLVKDWAVSEHEVSGRRFRLYSDGIAVLVCGGIGTEAARRATEAVISLCHPGCILSVGYAGALDRSLRVGAVVMPSRVIDASDGSIAVTRRGEGTLLTFSSVAGVAQKAKLAAAYGASAVDMEAAAVARGAQAHGVDFMALKVVSDEFDFSLPEIAKFVSSDGRFSSAGFALHAALRPWLWPSVIRLAVNSARASAVLCRELANFVAAYSSTTDTTPKQMTGTLPGPMHPISSNATMEEVRK